MSDEESNAGRVGSWKETRLRNIFKSDEGLNAEKEIHKAFYFNTSNLYPEQG